MLVSIEQILNIPDTNQSFGGKLNLSHIKRGPRVLFPELLAVTGTVANRAGVVTLRYQISGVAPFACDRCLMQAEHNFSLDFCHTVVKSLEDSELEDVFLICKDGVLNLGEIAASDLLLWLPSQLLCREDCKGLCPTCGANRNEGACSCQKDEVDPRLLKLKELLDK